MAALQSAGLTDIWGFEPLSGSSPCLSEQLQAHIVTREEEALELCARVGSVTLIDVLEHLSDPVTVLGSIRQHVAADARLYITVPFSDAWEHALFGRFSFALQLPTHYALYNARSLAALASATGWEIERTSYRKASFAAPSALLALGIPVFGAQRRRDRRLHRSLYRAVGKLASVLGSACRSTSHINVVMKVSADGAA